MDEKHSQDKRARTQDIANYASLGEPRASVKVEVVPREPEDPRKPPQHKRVMDAANWIRLGEWVGQKLGEGWDYVGGMFCRRPPNPA